MSPRVVARARGELATRGWSIVPRTELGEGADDLADPWALVTALVGTRPRMLERQPIRPLPNGRSFASTTVFTPLHTDSQEFMGVPPALQVMICKRPARAGGETLLTDGWALLATIERAEPHLYDSLFTVDRAIPFYFGAVHGPTVAQKRGAVVLTVSPVADQDAIGTSIARFVARAPVTSVRVERDQILLVDNHRMLHGRTAFADGDRELLRLLVWMNEPFSRPEALLQQAREVVAARGSAHAEERMRAVIDLVAGVPPAKLAAREQVTEAELYRWRNVFFAGGLASLAAESKRE